VDGGRRKAFDERAERLGAQYAKLSPVEGLYVNPKLTMGENIGDLSGLAQAYRATGSRSRARRRR
jgi:endothelin-converting enzyme/putative endopeptidase